MYCAVCMKWHQAGGEERVFSEHTGNERIIHVVGVDGQHCHEYWGCAVCFGERSWPAYASETAGFIS
jgi:hypothetical protein